MKDLIKIFQVIYCNLKPIIVENMMKLVFLQKILITIFNVLQIKPVKFFKIFQVS